MNDKFKPKTYSTIGNAKRAGRNACHKNNWRSYTIAHFGDIIMAAGPDRENLDNWIAEREIPVRKGDISVYLVYPHKS